MKYIKDIKDLKIGFDDNWDIIDDSICGVCYMDTTNEVIDKYFGIDLMTNGVLDKYSDFYYVMNFEYDTKLQDCLLVCDFCGVTSSNYPSGYVYNFKLEDWEKRYLLEKFVEYCSLIKNAYLKEDKWIINF